MLLQLDLYLLTTNLFRFLICSSFVDKIWCLSIGSEGIIAEVSFKKDSSELCGTKSKSTQIKLLL